MTAATPAAEAQTPVNHDVAPIQLPHRQRIEILIAVLLGIFLAALDQTIVGTALPVIVSELQGNDVYMWAFTSYLLTATISGPIYGKLSDIFGRRIIFTIGVSIFLLGSVLCSLSQEMWQFILFRGIQGLGAGALFPVALAIIGDIFAPSERGQYQGFFGAVFGVSTLVGPALGGLITDNFGWHWIFWSTCPSAGRAGRHLAHAAYADRLGGGPAYRLPRARRSWRRPWCRCSSASPTSSSANGPIWTSAVSSLWACFSSRSSCWSNRARRSRSCRCACSAIRDFTASVTAFFLAAMGFFAAVVFLPRWFQLVHGNSATESGYQILPLLLGLIVSAIATGQIVSRTERYKALTVAALLVTRVRAVPAHQHPAGHARCRCCGYGWRSPAWASARASPSSRSSCRTPCPCGSWARRPAA